MSKNISRDKHLYRDLCDMGLEVPVFFQAWWLDAVCGEAAWQIAMYVEDPNVVAIMPYYVKRIAFFNYVSMPVLTKFMGPFFIRRFDDRKNQSILNKLVEALPPFSGFAQTLHYQIKNWLPYKWKGFKQTAYYSYVLGNIEDLDQTWLHLDADYRNNKIAKAKEIFEIKEDPDFDTLFHLTAEPFQRQKIKLPVSKEQLRTLVEVIYKRNQGKSFSAVDKEGIVVAVALIVWDRKSSYLLLAGENEISRTSGGGLYLIWKAIEFTAKDLHLNRFDFLGGMSENLERTRRQFGADQVPYFLITKYTGLFKLWQLLQR